VDRRPGVRNPDGYRIELIERDGGGY